MSAFGSKILPWLVEDIHLEPYTSDEALFLEHKWNEEDTVSMQFSVEGAHGQDG